MTTRATDRRHLELHRKRLPLLESDREVDRAARPVYAVWELTLQCDQACDHCGSRAGHARPDELSTEQALDLVRQLAELGVKEITLIGGEAYLRADWLEIIRAIRARGMMSTMTTGGRNLTAQRALDAAAAGLQSASVSLDGLEATHDGLRGRASFKSALSAIENLVAAGLPVGVNSQISRRSHSELDELLELIIAVGAHAWQIALTVAMGRAADRPEVLLQPHDLHDLFPVLARLSERCAAAGVRLSRGNNVGYFGPFEELFNRDSVSDHSCGCGAGRDVIGIEADGTIKGCPSLPTDGWSGGSVRDASLRDIWERSRALQVLRDPPRDKLWGFCATCYYAEECAGGCTWTADALLGRPGNNPYCHHRVLELKKRGLRERIERTAAPPGLPFDRGRFDLILEPWE